MLFFPTTLFVIKQVIVYTAEPSIPLQYKHFRTVDSLFVPFMKKGSLAPMVLMMWFNITLGSIWYLPLFNIH